MYKHLLAVPFIILTVLHSHDGYGLEQPWHGYLAAAGMSALLWVAYYHVINPSSKWWVRVLTIIFALLISGSEAVALYLHKGSVEAPGYAQEKAEYDRKLAAYTANLDAWQYRTKQTQIQRDGELNATAVALQEIVDNDKLTSQRTRYDELTEKLSKIRDTKPELAPTFDLKEPVKQYVFNTKWAFTVGLLVSLTPIAIILLHLFEHKNGRIKVGETAPVTVKEKATIGVTVESVPVTVETVPVTVEENVTIGVTVGDIPVTVENVPVTVGVTVENVPVTVEENVTVGVTVEENVTVGVTVAEKITTHTFPTFPCPICGTPVILNRVDRTTCGASKCKQALLRRNKTLPLNVVNIGSRTKKGNI